MDTAKAGGHAGGRGARSLSVLVIALATILAVVSVPDRAPEDGPPGPRELVTLIGTDVGTATARLAERRIHRSNNGEDEFHYLSPDGCHAHLKVRLVVVGRFVMGWTRSGADGAAPGCAGTAS